MATASCAFTESAYPNGRDNGFRMARFYGKVAIGASPGTYVTNGLPLATLTETGIGSGNPLFGTLNGINGYIYKYDPAHGTVRIYQVAAQAGTFTGTPATLTGTVAAPTISTVNDSGTPTKAIGELTGALSSNGALTGVTGVQAPALTMNSYTPAGSIAGVAGALVELGNGVSIPAGVSGDTIDAEFVCTRSS